MMLFVVTGLVTIGYWSTIVPGLWASPGTDLHVFIISIIYLVSTSFPRHRRHRPLPVAVFSSS